ncbi:MAG: hypothetical protein M1834_005820 [Cirrosporium novae-zelandiae]|nr:MAG: hypothetical protein M1834_005820 [Cirrosporium novae-zelandiae]
MQLPVTPRNELEMQEPGDRSLPSSSRPSPSNSGAIINSPPAGGVSLAYNPRNSYGRRSLIRIPNNVEAYLKTQPPRTYPIATSLHELHNLWDVELILLGFPSDVSSDSSRIRIRVSSKHLILASPVFRSMLEGEFKESKILESDKSVQIPLPDEDPNTFLLIMLILHGLNREVPRKISVTMLAKVATIVDKYELYEAVDTFLEIWLSKLKTVRPTMLSRAALYNLGFTDNIIPWLWISSVFKLDKDFQFIKKLAAEMSAGKFEEENIVEFPIRDSVIDGINEARQRFCKQFYEIVRSLLLNHKHRVTICSLECDTVILDILLRFMRELRLSEYLGYFGHHHPSFCYWKLVSWIEETTNLPSRCLMIEKALKRAHIKMIVRKLTFRPWKESYITALAACQCRGPRKELLELARICNRDFRNARSNLAAAICVGPMMASALLGDLRACDETNLKRKTVEHLLYLNQPLKYGLCIGPIVPLRAAKKKMFGMFI